MARIKNSHGFCNSARAKEFLSYVVDHGLNGHTELLKERLIGVNLYNRAPTFVTSDDPIVRVNAAEVRRRLVEYYAEEEQSPKVRIELPVGSYVPKFHFEAPAGLAAAMDSPPREVQGIDQKPRRPTRVGWRIVLPACVLIILALAVGISTRQHAQPKSQLDQFWAPVFATGQPVLICISSPVVYSPHLDVYQRASGVHPDLYNSQLQRAMNPLQLEPNTRLKWKDIEPFPDEFVGKAHVYTVASLAVLFDRIKKPSQVKVGSDFSFNDLQNSPAVLLGAFDNPWSVRMAAELPFYFREEDGAIVERGGQNRIWRTGPGPSNPKDFAIIARLLNSKSGQFLVILGGISDPGTVASGKLVSRQDLLNTALRFAPAGWQNKNLEFVIETDRIGNSDSSTRVVAVNAW